MFSRPHCYGIVDEESLPADCFEPASAATPGTKKVQGSPRAEGEGFDWASGEWTVEGSGWAGWDRSDDRYTDEDREAARVGYFAGRCWGLYGVSGDSPTYRLMKRRMESNDCPNEDASRESSGDSRSDYDTALAGVLREDTGPSASGGYRAVLNALEEKETELRREESDSDVALAGVSGENSGSSASGDYQAAVSAADCKAPDQRVVDAMKQAEARGKGGSAAIAYCAAANIQRALIWKILNCDSSSLNSTEKRQLRQQLEVTRNAVRQNKEGYRALTDGGNCECWSSICAE